LLASLPIDDIHLARVAQMAETDFVGAPVGIMDQMASSIGREREALLLDTRTLAVDRVPIPVSLEIIVIDSAVPHAHAGGEYATRRRESFEAARLRGVEHLRDAPLDRVEALPLLLARRARHIVTENRRVFETADALRRGDGPALGVLFAASHASMRDDYETSTAEVDTLVGIGQQHPDVFGARLTGGGFGGAVVMVTSAGSGRAAALDIRDRYRARTGRHGEVLVPPGRNLENVSR
jgi:galactokinase